MITTSEIFHDTRILNEASTLSSRYKVKILAKKYSLRETDPVKRPFEIKQVDYRKIPVSRLNIFSGQFALMKAAFRENPDVYHAHDLDGLLCAFPAALFKRRVLIYDSHELWSDTFPFPNLKRIQWLLGPLEKLLMVKVKTGITVNDSIANLLEKRYHKRFISLRNFPNIIGKKKSSLNFKARFPGKKIVLHLGSADAGRGHEQIIEAAKYLPRNILIVFLGAGSFGDYFKSKVSELGLTGKIFFLPPVPPQEIIETCKYAELGLVLHQNVSLSYYHALPNKIFQYIAAETPVLGSNFPEMKKIIIKNKIGEVVDPSKPKLIAQKIISMASGSSQARYRKNLHALKGIFNWDFEAEKLKNLYQELEYPQEIGISRKFKLDVTWNAVSLALLGLSGIIFNFIIARVYGSQVLGMFNEVYAIYILASQLAVGSIHSSVQKYIPSHLEERQKIDQIVSSGLIITLISSFVISFLIYFSRNIWGFWFKDADVIFGVGLVSFGLIGFALNKTFLALLNGLRLMRPFAIFSGLRYLFILGFVILLVAFHYRGAFLPLAFPLAEALLLVSLVVYSRRFFNLTFSWGQWLKKHLIFGYHALLGNILLDVNTRVDILILGFFTSTRIVGIYSFPALLTEGLSQILAGALKLNVNPILARLSAKKDWVALRRYIQVGVRKTYLYFSLIGVIAVGFYPFMIKLILPNSSFNQGWPVFAILVGGLILSSGYQPFQMLLAQAGLPKFYSWLILIVFAINTLLNFLLVPVLGMYGSALATAFSFIALALTLKFLTKKVLNFKI